VDRSAHSCDTCAVDLPRLALALAAGALLGLASPDAGGALAAWIGFTLLVLSQRGAWLAGLIWYALAIAWFPEAWARFAGERGLGLFALLIALQASLPVVAAALGLWGRRALPWPVAAGAAWALASVAADLLQPLPADPSLFLAGAGPLSWPLAVGGRPLLVGGLAALAAWSERAPRAAAFAFGGWLLIGVAWVLAPEAPASTVRIGVVQPGTGAFDARRASTAPRRADRLVALIEGLGPADLIVTPEGAWPMDPGEPGSAARVRFLERWPELPPTLLGASVGGEEPVANSLLLVSQREVRARYDKRVLVPVAERARFGLGRDRYRPGQEAPILHLGDLHLGVMLCYEDLFASAIQQAARGSELLVSATNDAWLGPGRGGQLHLAASTRAAIESRRWVARSTTNGGSAFIDTRGRAVWRGAWVDGDRRPDAPPLAAVLDVPRLQPLWDGTRGAQVVTPLAALLLLLGGRRRVEALPPAEAARG
jgi:apolipoprotein N-acyltransferase